MGPNGNVTYNTGEGKGHYRNTAGFTKEGVQKPSPMRPPNKNKNKTHKAQMRVLKGKSLQCSISWSQDQEATVEAASSHFSGFLCKSSRFWEWNLVHGTHTLLLLEKGFHFQFHQQPHPPEPKTGQKYFKLHNFLFSLPPHPDWQILQHTQPSQPQSLWICIFCCCCSLSV